MLELVLVLVFLAGVGWVGVRAFSAPKGVYLRSLMSLAIAVGAAGAVWAIGGSFISNEAGLGAFVLFCIVVALSAFAAVAACIAASLRYACDAMIAGRK